MAKVEEELAGTAGLVTHSVWVVMCGDIIEKEKGPG